jgi:hypothetical protein
MKSQKMLKEEIRLLKLQISINEMISVSLRDQPSTDEMKLKLARLQQKAELKLVND